MLRQSLSVALTTVALMLFGQFLNAADVLVGTKIAANKRISVDSIDHSAWNSLLQKYVNEQGMVNYQAWKSTADSNEQLKRYLSHLSSADLDAQASKESRLAFWINAYNAVTVQGILDKYPVKSIRDLTPKLWGFHIWKNLKLQVDDQQVNLDSMEHQILRKMGEPRIHFAIVCASISCPRLLNQAYTADQLDAQLELNAKNFFAQPGNFQFNPKNKSVVLSSILNWFEKDFGSNQQERLALIAQWVSRPEDQELLKKSGVSVSYASYDWGLNKQ